MGKKEIIAAYNNQLKSDGTFHIVFDGREGLGMDNLGSSSIGNCALFFKGPYLIDEGRNLRQRYDFYNLKQKHLSKLREKFKVLIKKSRQISYDVAFKKR